MNVIYRYKKGKINDIKTILMKRNNMKFLKDFSLTRIVNILFL